jgi:tetratricopeptide (TPR) repeat protein
METAAHIKELIVNGDTTSAIQTINAMLDKDGDVPKDVLFYLRGNAYRKLADWRQAINSYLEAIHINPQSEACEAYQMVMDILNFYHKDNFNP